jgi:ADP-heptose:LPS heptosyltransferase
VSATALLRLSALGDILLTEPVARLLKEREPGRRIVYITKERFAQVPRGWPAVDEVLALADPIDGPALARLRRRLGELDVDRRMDLHNTWRSHRLWPWAEGRLAKHRWQKWRLVHGKALPGRPGDPGPVWRRCLAAAGLHEVSDQERPRLVVEGVRLEWGARRHLALVPGAGFATKSWPEEHWAQLLDALVTDWQEPVLLLGGAAETGLGARLAARHPGRVENLCGRLGLAESARRVADARLVVCGDTGLLHMADAAGVPGVALFGSTVRELGFFPLGGTLSVLERPLPCRPCSHTGRVRCPLGHLDCLRGIAPHEVRAACREAVERAEAPGGAAC